MKIFNVLLFIKYTYTYIYINIFRKNILYKFVGKSKTQINVHTHQPT